MSKESEMDDVTSELTPAEVLAVKILRLAQGSYCDWIPRWAWQSYESRARAVAAELSPLLAERDRLVTERDAITRWSIRHAGYLGTTDGHEHCPDGHKWWARGDKGDVTAPTAETAVRLAAGLDTSEGGAS